MAICDTLSRVFQLYNKGGLKLGSRSRPFVCLTREQRETGGIRFRPTYALNSHLSPSSTGSRILSSHLSSTSAGNAPDATIFTIKGTLRERWRQIVTEGTRGLGFFLATIDEGMKESQRAIWSRATGASQGLRDCEYPKSPGVAHSKRKRPI